MPIGKFLQEMVRRYPNKEAVLNEGNTATFTEVNARVNRLANALLDMGLQPGDKLAIVSRNCTQYREIYLTRRLARHFQMYPNWRGRCFSPVCLVPYKVVLLVACRPSSPSAT